MEMENYSNNNKKNVLPPPQVTGHFDHELQLPYEDQPPFTEKSYFLLKYQL
jgi:hypothetical protein